MCNQICLCAGCYGKFNVSQTFSYVLKGRDLAEFQTTNVDPKALYTQYMRNKTNFTKISCLNLSFSYKVVLSYTIYSAR